MVESNEAKTVKLTPKYSQQFKYDENGVRVPYNLYVIVCEIYRNVEYNSISFVFGENDR